MGRVLQILFNTDMVLAILDGRKTNTRRVVKKSHCTLLGKMEPSELNRKYAPYDSMTDAELVACTYRPQYNPGDILYVRETWAQIKDIPFWQEYFRGDTRTHPIFPDEYVYKADNINVDGIFPDIKWRPSIHMPKQAARIWLRVTDVRVERLQEIENVYAEGICLADFPDGYTWKPNTDIYNRYTDPIAAMAELWDSTISKEQKDLYGWEANPWVWAIEFEKCEKPVREE